MFRSALLILSGNATASLLLLARNLLVARLISVEDYGIAATFAITITLVEMMSQLGLQQQIVQAKNGEDTRFQTGLQGFQVLRGVIAGAVLFFAAGSIARFLNIPDVAWAYQVMALVPILAALQHFDIHRLNRQMRFWPMVLTGGIPALISLVTVLPLYFWFGDYQTMLWAILVQMGLMTLVSHLVAERPYRLVFDRQIMGESLRFGWPLLVNGMLMFAVFNGDKLIVGSVIGMEALAILAMGFTLTLTPTLVMAKSAQNFFLPQLSAVQGTAQFPTLSTVTMQAILIMSLLVVIGVAVLGVPLVNGLLGAKYGALIPLMIWLAIMQAIRVAKAGPALAALAVGQTTNMMYSNLTRALLLPASWYVAQTTGDLMMIVWLGIFGEVLGYALSLLLVRTRLKIPLQSLLMPLGLSVALMSLSAWMVTQRVNGPTDYVLLIGEIALYVVGIGAVFWSCKDLRHYLKNRHANAMGI